MPLNPRQRRHFTTAVLLWGLAAGLTGRVAPALASGPHAPPHASPHASPHAPLHPVPAARPAPVLALQTEDNSYRLAGKGFSVRLEPDGTLSDFMCRDQVVLLNAALEVRGPTWHIKLAAKPEQVRTYPPAVTPEGRRFHYDVNLEDAATSIQIRVSEVVSVLASGEIDVTLRVIPQSAFQAHRISWNVEFPADAYAGSVYSYRSDGAGSPEQTGRFPQDRAPDPHMARNFNWIRLNRNDGYVELKIESEGAKGHPVPVQDTLEDLRWWNVPHFWIPVAAPYAAGAASAPPVPPELEKPTSITPGDVRTIRIRILLHCSPAR